MGDTVYFIDCNPLLLKTLQVLHNSFAISQSLEAGIADELKNTPLCEKCCN